MRPPSSSTCADTRDPVALAPLTLRELDALCATPCGLDAYSPLLERRYLLLATAAADRLPAAALRRIASRLRQIPVPVVAVGSACPTALLRGVDVIVPAAAEAGAMIANINANPLASMTLVQVLRHNEDVAPAQGLFAESLAYASLQGGPEFARAQLTLPKPASHEQAQPGAVRVERSGERLHITLNRPAARNAFCVAMRDEFYAALQLLATEQRLRGAIVSGAGSCFCIGGDLREFGARPDVATAHAVRASRNVAAALLALSARLEFHLHRACIGAGVEMPAFAARVVAHSDTFFQLPEIKLGLLPGAGGTVSIPRRIGRHRTAYLALSARRINSATALQWGLVDALV